MFGGRFIFKESIYCNKQLTLLLYRRGRNGQLGRADHIESVAAPRLTPVECSFFRGKRIKDIVSFNV